MDKVVPRLYNFRSGPTLALPLGQNAKKSKISVVHSLVVLKAHPECLKSGKPNGGRDSVPGPRWGSLQLAAPPQELHPALGPSGLQPWLSGLAPCLPKCVYQIRLCSKLNLF